jgi:predicted amidophosphoribosyltransferase
MTPLVHCDVHPHRGEPRPAWIVCVHLFDCRIPIAYLEYPQNDELGIMLCSGCRAQYATLEPLRIQCPDCVNQLLQARDLRP